MDWVGDVFRPLERFERLLARLYQDFSEQFQDDDAARLFAQLQRASTTNRSQIELLLRLARSIERELAAEVEIDGGRLRREIQAVERIREMRLQIGLDAAIVQSLQLECGEARRVSRHVLGTSHPKITQMIRGFGPRRDATNIPSLVDFASVRGIAVPPSVTTLAERTRAEIDELTGRARADAAAAQALANADEQRRAQEEAELEAAVREGKSIIDYRLDRKQP